MANNNVQNIKFLRNGSVFTPSVDPVKTAREVALAAMNGQIDNLADGTAILGRYQETNGTVKTLVGFAYVSGDTKTLTVFDVEGASADVEALRTEINNKLGDGVTSANTVTDQLAALSGDSSTAQSSDTSVEGAKKYADEKISQAVSNLDYTGVTTGDAVVVTNVTEADGVVAATSANVGNLKLTDYTKGSDSGAVASTDTINAAVAKLENQIDAEKDARAAAIDALDYTDTAVTKQFVAAVDETDGVISVTRGELQSSGKTIVITADGNNVNFEANVDGTTIIVDENTGTMSVASSALVQYEGDDDTIQIGAVSEGKRIVSSPLTIQKVTTGLSEEVKEEYHLVGASGTTIGDPVKIYKDSHIVSIEYQDNPEQAHYQNLIYTYLDASGATQVAYVDISELVLEAEFASGVTVTNHVAHGVVDPTSETFLTVGAGGFKLSGVQDAIDAAVNGLDADVSGNSTHVTVGVVEENGEITAVTVSESNIANADDLAMLSGKTVTAITSTNGSITASIDDAVGNKTYDIETDASKIKMTGFTAAESGFTAITSASTVTEAVKAIETVMIDNEEVTAAALNDLEDKIEELSGGSAADLAAEIAARKAVDGIDGDAYSANTNANYISAATSLNDADQKLDAALNTVSGDLDTVKTNYVSGVSVNGNAVTVANHVAPISITAATSAATATSTEAIVVDTDANGHITIGLADIDAGTY